MTTPTRLFAAAGDGSCAHALIIALLVGASGALVSCTHPLDRNLEDMMRRQTIESQRAYDNAVSKAQDVVIEREPGDVTRNLSQERIAELEQASGILANEKITPDLGKLLTGEKDIEAVAMTLERAMQLMLENNVDLKIARLVPALRETQITQAESVFDATFFSAFNFQKLDTLQPPTPTALAQFGSVQQETAELTTGVRKLLATGGQVTASTTMGYNERNPSFFIVNDYYDTDVSLSFQQPLLRNFGGDVTRSQILLARNAKEQALEDLKQSILDRMVETEQAYWTLVFQRERLLSAQRVVERSRKNFDIVKGREGFDVTEVQVSQVASSYADRKLDLINAQRDFYLASDQLKRLIDSPDLPLTGETVIVPIDRLVDASLTFNLKSAIFTAMRNRPDIQRALSEIGDATIRQRVADNQRLPVLDLTGTVRWQGISTDNIEEGYDHTTEGEFIDYVLGFEFEAPIGNRGPEALLQQRRIERNAAVMNYRRIVQDSVGEVKGALRVLRSAYSAIGAAHDSRLASARVVQGLDAQIDAQVALTPEFVQLVVQQDEELFIAEIREVQSLADYNTAIANYYRAVGTLLEHNGVEFSRDAARK